MTGRFNVKRLVVIPMIVIGRGLATIDAGYRSIQFGQDSSKHCGMHHGHYRACPFGVPAPSRVIHAPRATAFDEIPAFMANRRAHCDAPNTCGCI